MKTFYKVLINVFLASITNYTVWFALTYFTYLKTSSVFAMSLMSGVYLIATAGLGIWLGGIVDHNRKKPVMLVSSAISLFFFMIAAAVYFTAPVDAFSTINSVYLWVVVLSGMTGVIAGNLRTIALPTITTLLVPAEKREKANGLVGMVNGVGFLVVSAISGILVGTSELVAVFIIALVMTVVTMIHLSTVKLEEKEIVHLEGAGKGVDLVGTYRVVKAVPGLIALILFSTFNNFLGGIFITLMDAYGLSMVSVQTWGFMWAFISTGFIFGGIAIAKLGLGGRPLRALLFANAFVWLDCMFFTAIPSLYVYAIGSFVYLCVVPFIEAAEQTLIQAVVPRERQGRVFGFAQSVEQAASPLMAFAIGPIAEFWIIPSMTDGYLAGTIGTWFGTGHARAIALIFSIAGLVGFLATLLALRSKAYKTLTKRYDEALAEAKAEVPTEVVA